MSATTVQDPGPATTAPAATDVSMGDAEAKKLEPGQAAAQAVSAKEPKVEVAPSATNNVNANESKSTAAIPNGTAVEVKIAPEEEKKVVAATNSPALSSSAVSSANPDVTGDEIVVGAGPHPPRSNGQMTSAARPKLEQADETMTEAEDQARLSHYPKRKRASLYSDLGEDKIDRSVTGGRDERAAPPTSSRRQQVAATKGVLVGYWRDSPVPKEASKHAVIGFMDVRDRLRTRIQNVTTSGDMINTRLFPIPPGPGGSWVVFDRVVFSSHLVGLNHHEVKEYVKVRHEAVERGGEDSEEATRKAELAAVDEAVRRVREHPPPETAQPVAIAYGAELPDSSHASHRPDKRRRTGSATGASSNNTPIVPQAASMQPASEGFAQPLPENLNSTRPTRILVGCWSRSSAPRDEDKHAVYGILGANDMFRVKLVRETMDGRFVDGNFPLGAGALWIAYEEVKFLPHIQQLSRPEMKEYCRVRQAQIDNGETEAMRIANESQAVYEAQRRAAIRALAPAGPPGGRSSLPGEYDELRDSPTPHELRQGRRDAGADGRQTRHSLGDVESRPRYPSDDTLEHNNSLARQSQMRQDRHSAQRQGSATPAMASDNRAIFRHNVQGLQGVWQKQEADRVQSMTQQQQQAPPHPAPAQQMQGIGTSNPNGETIWHLGMKYERKLTGAFAGKLVSQGTILNINGDDYVEYRVLTKPTFF